MAHRGISAEQMKALAQAIETASSEAQQKSVTSIGQKQTSSSLGDDAANLRHQTAYLRTAGNAAFPGRPERNDFDPPSRARAPRAKALPAAAN